MSVESAWRGRCSKNWDEIIVRFFCGSFLVLHCATGVAASQPAATEAEGVRPYSVDDLVALEDTGSGASDPGGRRLVWEQAPAYSSLGEYGLHQTGAWGLTGWRLMTLDLASDELVPKPLFEPEPATTYWIDSFSPSGRYLVFYGASKDGAFIAAYDFESGRIRRIDNAPRIHWFLGRESVWVSDEEFVFAAHEKGRQPALFTRRETGKQYWNAWNDTWEGQRASVSVVDSLAYDEEEAWLPGRLIKANARTGASIDLADGAFDSLAVSIDRRYLAGLRQAKRPQPDPNTLDEDWVLARSQLVVFDLKLGGQGRIVSPGKDIYPTTLVWASEHNRLAYFAWDHGAGVQNGTFHAFNADASSVGRYPHTGLDLVSERERGFRQKPERALWVGDELAVFARVNHGSDTAHAFSYRNRVVGHGDASDRADWYLIEEGGGFRNATAELDNVSPIPVAVTTMGFAVLADGDVWLVDRDAQAANLTEDIDGRLSLPFDARYRKSVRHSPLTSRLTLLAGGANRGHTNFLLLDVSDGSKRVINTRKGEVSLLASSVSRYAVLYRTDDEDGTVLWLHTNDKSVEVGSMNEHLQQVSRTHWTPIEYEVETKQGAKGIKSCLLLPPNYKPDRRYPVIVDVYPSRRPSCMYPGFSRYSSMAGKPTAWDLHLLAAKGYVVFQPSTPRELTWSTDDPLEGFTSLVTQGVDALVRRKIADPSRVGLIGFSQGGFASLLVSAQTDYFKAAVSLNGWADMYSHYFEGSLQNKFYSALWPYVGAAQRYESRSGTDFSIGRSAWEDPDAYVRNSPLFQARNIESPVLLVHSDMDAFTLAQYEQMFTALYRQRKAARFLRYWGEGHLPSSPANIRHLWEEVFAWYGHHLGPGESLELDGSEGRNRDLQ